MLICCTEHERVCNVYSLWTYLQHHIWSRADCQIPKVGLGTVAAYSNSSYTYFWQAH